MRLSGSKFGLVKVSVTVLDHLSDRQRRAYALADNRLLLTPGGTRVFWRLDWSPSTSRAANSD
jgi:hypothetical protein